MKSKIVTISSIAIFSIVLWVFISFSADYSATIKIPVKFHNIPEGYALKNISAEDISLSLKGEGWQLAQLTFGTSHYLDIVIDETAISDEVGVRNSLEQSSWLPSSLQLMMIEPEQINYSLERINYKNVKISERIKLNFKPGYGLVSDITIEPDTIMISGPKSVIQNIDTVYTEKVTVNSLDAEYSQEITLAEIENVTFPFKQVFVKFDVQKIVDKTFENVFVERRGVPPSRDLSLFPERVDVILRGGIKMLGRLDNSSVKLFVNFSQAIEDTLGFLEPQIKIPLFTSLIDIRPKRLDYIIKQY
ncbi:MAG: YbbR-like domain-containing protein [Melioribacteraceae bacterium]|nr:YbbR-like domain-containing protein [Melioribacteraceae bacterium]